MSYQILYPKNEDDWLNIRTTVVTATEMPVILGLNPYERPSGIKEKKQKVERFENAYTLMGQWLESFVIDRVNEVTNMEFKGLDNSEFYIRDNLKLGATPDALDRDIEGTRTLLECKTTKPRNYLVYQNLPPLYYLMQLYTQMYCANIEEGLLGIMSTDLTQHTPDLDLKLCIHQIERDEQIDAIIEKEVPRFWESKNYRVDRKQTAWLSARLYCNSKRIY